MHQRNPFSIETKITSPTPFQPSVQTLLKRQFPDLANHSLGHDFYFVHRLDYATSGLLCIPLTKTRCAQLSRQFEKRQITKFYLAIVRGHISGLHELSIDIPVGEDIRYKTANNRMCTSHDWEHCLSPRRGETKLIVLERGFYETEFATKVLLQPVTGRRHQLRVHCNEIGHPIVGDFTYSSHAADCDQNSSMAPPRMMLHAFRIQIPAVGASGALDLVTEDPFKALDGVRWHTKEVVNGLEEAMERISSI